MTNFIRSLIKQTSNLSKNGATTFRITTLVGMTTPIMTFNIPKMQHIKLYVVMYTECFNVSMFSVAYNLKLLSVIMLSVIMTNVVCAKFRI